MAGPSSNFNWDGYGNFRRLFGWAVLGGLVAFIFAAGRPPAEMREALVSALVPIGFVIVLGFGYGADLPRRVARFGPDREEHTFSVVSLFFLVALATVAFTLAYLTVEERRVLCLVTCGFEIEIPGVGRWQNPFRLGYSTAPKYLAAGVGAVLAGSVQLLTTLVAPRKLGPDVPFRSLSRRVGWRVVAVTVFWCVGWLLVIPAAVAVTDFGLPFLSTLRLVVALFSLGAIAFEIWHPWGRVMSAPNGEPARPWKVVLRALVMSFVFTPWADLAVLSWTLTASHLPEFLIARVLLGLAAVAALVHAQGQGIPDVFLKVYIQGNQAAGTQSDGTAALGNRSIRPPPFDPDPADPFAKDLLGRRSHVVGLIDRVVTLAGPATVMVDGGWGSGKTAFLRMCAADLRSRGETVIEFDAWAAQHTQRPALDLLGALSEGITDPGAGRLAAARTRLATSLRGAVPDPRYDSWNEQRRAAISIRQSLESAAAEHGRLVLIIDELDRCPPSYALEALADIHHLFAVERVVVIVGVNRGELCEAVRTVYGPKFKADGYLRRLADIHVSLPAMTQTDTSDFFANAVREAGLTETANPRSVQILRLVVDLKTCALRDLQQAVHIYATAVTAPSPPALPLAVWEMSLAAMTVLRFADPNAFRAFVAGTIDSFEALAKAYAAFGPEPILMSGDTTVPFHGLRVEVFSAALLNITRDSSDWCAKPAKFRERYIPIHRLRPTYVKADAGAAADQVLTILCRAIRRQYDPAHGPWSRPEAAEVAAALDLAYQPYAED